ncbi:MAG: cupin domain-containing protein [Kofleriaceae bacterium]
MSAADVPEEIDRYPGSDEAMAPSRPIGRVAGLLRIGLHLTRVPPGTRTSWPHAESDEEEFVYVIAGEVDAWIDGHVHRLRAGDLAAFPAGTGACHTILNDGDAEALVLVGGEASKRHNRLYYPRHPERRAQLPWSQWWDDVPARAQGPHPGTPAALTPGAGRAGRASGTRRRR